MLPAGRWEGIGVLASLSAENLLVGTATEFRPCFEKEWGKRVHTCKKIYCGCKYCAEK